MYHLTVFKKQQVIRVSYQADTMWIIEFDLNKQCLQQTGHHASFKSTYFLKIMYLVGLDRNTVFIFYFLNLYLLIFRETEEGEGRENLFVVPLIDAFIDCFLCVPWPEMEPVTLEYQEIIWIWIFFFLKGAVNLQGNPTGKGREENYFGLYTKLHHTWDLIVTLFLSNRKTTWLKATI